MTSACDLKTQNDIDQTFYVFFFQNYLKIKIVKNNELSHLTLLCVYLQLVNFIINLLSLFIFKKKKILHILLNLNMRLKFIKI